MLIQECAMNRFTFKSILAAFCLFLLPSMASALPGPHDPLTGGNGIVCESCHTAGSTLGATTWDNVCLTCHNGSSTAANGHIVQSFKQADFADPFGTSTPRTGTVYQTSHKWTGTDTQPLAGALPPTDKYAVVAKNNMNKASVRGSVTCARCHNIHGNSGTQSTVFPYLRSINSDDQMCLDCHRTRDHVSQTFGTHPVNINYAATYAAYTAKFYPTPRSAFPNNTTAAMKMINGKIQCSTCHGVHYTDSGKSGLAQKSVNFNKITTANGRLLRAALRSNTVNDVGLCTNCHKAMNHNGASQGIQCADCHTGHVEYDATAVTAQEKLPNLYLLRRYINVSTSFGAVRNKKVLFTSVTSASYTSTQSGICNACHSAPQSHDINGRTTTKCTNCHTHKGINGNGFTGGCSSCHGYPPTTNTAGGSTGYANDPATGHNYAAAKNESQTGHLTHTSNPLNYSCDDCHKGNAHNTGTFTDVFINKAGLKASLNGSVPSYAPAGSGTCSSVYCHSNGNPAAMVYKAVNWGDALTTGKIVGTANECVSCHDGVISGSNTMATNAHFKHVDSTGRNIGCVVCHAATVSSNTVIANAANHVNGIRDVSFSGSLASGGSWNGSSCATSYCHSNGAGSFAAPVWNTPASGQCGTCHGTATAPILASGSHQTHFTVVGDTTPGVVCVKCHVYVSESDSTHINKTLNFVTPGVGVGCAANSCHATITPPTWGANTGNNTCTKCHGTGTVTVNAANRDVVAPVGGTLTGTGLVSDNAKVGAHKTHLRYLNGFSNYSTVDYRCETCHGALPVVGTHANSTSTPNFQNLATRWGAIATASFSAGSCNNIYCHNPAGAGGTLDAANAGTGVSPLWTNGAYLADGGKSKANCEMCHKVPGSAGFSKQSAHGGMDTDASPNQCNSCHGHNGDAVGAIGQRHIDGIRYASGACNSCHGYPPVSAAVIGSVGVQGNYSTAKEEDYVNGGGAHSVPGHVSLIALPGSGWANCAVCHSGGSLTPASHTMSMPVQQSNVTIQVDPRYKFNPNLPIIYSGPLDNSTNTGTCSNVSCHFKFSPNWAQ